MRVTNTMMQNNALINMNKNKEYYNKYLEQYTTQKKIQKASDDPMIAVRSLKFRTNITEITQYIDSNIKDAQSWMRATEDAMIQVNTIYRTMIDNCTQGANDTLEPKDRNTILAAMKENVGFIFEQQANADNAGRYLFTGYRTNVPLVFEGASNDITYKITENLGVENIRRYSYESSSLAYVDGYTASNYAAAAPQYKDAYRMTLSYDKLDSLEGISYTKSDGSTVDLSVGSVSVTDTNAYDIDAFNTAGGTSYDAILIEETGEIIFSSNTYTDLKTDSARISVQYKRTKFEDKEVRPEHYFDCEATNNETGEVINYTNPTGQKIRYEINFSQSLQVNTMACDAFDMSVWRGVDSIDNICTMIEDTESQMSEVKKMINDTDENDVEKQNALNELYKQLQTKKELQDTMLQRAFSSMITTLQNAQDKLNKAVADHGSRDQRLTLTANKLKEQKVDFTEALSDNEDADLGDAYIKYNQADLLYQATLQATSKVLGNTLLDFI